MIQTNGVKGCCSYRFEGGHAGERATDAGGEGCNQLLANSDGVFSAIESIYEKIDMAAADRRHVFPTAYLKHLELIYYRLARSDRRHLTLGHA